jgi:hypothetical protein
MIVGLRKLKVGINEMWVKENKNPRILLDLPKTMDEMNV